MRKIIAVLTFILLSVAGLCLYPSGEEELSPPTFSISSAEFSYDGAPHEVGFEEIEHPSLEEGALAFAWYKDGEPLGVFSESIAVKDVADSGSYVCELTFTLGESSVTVTTPPIEIRINKAVLELPEIPAAEYNGDAQSPEIPSSELYLAEYTGGLVNAGSYPVRLTLTDSENYAWEGIEGAAAEVPFVIKKAQNSWTEKPHLPDYYSETQPSPVGTSRFGETVFSYSGSKYGTYTTAPPQSAGRYYFIAEVAECDNYTGIVTEPSEFFVVEDIPSSITLETPPEKTDYLALDVFEPFGLSVRVSFVSGRSEIIPEDRLSYTYLCGDGRLHFGDGAIYVSYLDLKLLLPLSIQKREYDLSGVSLEDGQLVYNGRFQSAELTGVLPCGLDGIQLECVSEGGGINVGRYIVSVTFRTESSDYKTPTPMSAAVEILPLPVNVIWGEGQFVYDGTPKVPSAVFIDENGREVPLAVEGAATAAAESYTAQARSLNENYLLLNQTAVFTVAKADYDMSGAAWTSSKFVYDGEYKEVIVTGLPSGVTVIGYADNKARDAGEYTARVSLSYDRVNYNPPAVSEFPWQIKKADYDISGFSFDDSEYVYDGAPHYPKLTGAIPTGKDGVTLTYSFSVGVLNVAEGLVTVRVIFSTESNNYNTPPELTRTVRILPRPIYVSWSELDFLYDGTPKLPRAVAAECAVSVSAGAVNAGEYTASAVSLNPNYAIMNPEGRYVIRKAENGWITPPTVSDIFEGGLPSPSAEAIFGDVEYRYYKNASLTEEAEPPYLPGDYYMLAVIPESENYREARYRVLKFSVIKIVPVSISASLNKTRFAAFERLTEEDITVEITNNNGESFVCAFNEITAVYSKADSFRYGDSRVTVTYGGLSAELAVTVDKASYDMSRVSWEGVRQVYDGEEKRAYLTGLPDGVEVVEYTGGIGVAAGRYPVSCTLSYDTENYYTPECESAELVILKCPVPLPKAEPIIYDGGVHSPYFESELYSQQNELEISTPGEYSVLLSLSDADNYCFENTEDSVSVLTVVILPRPITVRAEDIFLYLFEGLPSLKYTVSSGSLVDGDTLDVRFNVDGDRICPIASHASYDITLIEGKIQRIGSLSPTAKVIGAILLIIAAVLIFTAVIILVKREKLRSFISALRCKATVSRELPPPAPSEESRRRRAELPPEEKALLSVDVERAETLIPDSLAKDLIAKGDAPIYTDGKRKNIVNIDTLSDEFMPGERVDVNILKSKSLVPYDTAYIKVLARGVIDKPLRVYANDFSLSAVKMIALTGGEAVKVITIRKKDARTAPDTDKFDKNS